MIIIPTEKRIDWKKKPPIVLLIIVLLNILVFTFYQSLDEERVENAVNLYQEYELMDIEWPAYQKYWSRNKDEPLPSELEDSRQLRAWQMVMDKDFDDFLNKNPRRYIKGYELEKWRDQRQQVNALSNQVSYQALGLVPSEISFLTAFSHQFLHGGVMHLLGNLVFLLLVGFAVEAALGHLRFLMYYLLSGVGGGLFFAWFEMLNGTGNVGLVGASGAISGVMAMYVALFRLKKIEFFYWVFFIFTGYFRAAALVILPAYILKELFMLLFEDGSNVAYTAHIGGFVVGALLVMATQYLQKNAIDTEYLESDSDVDPYQIALDKLSKDISQFNFRHAMSRVQSMLKEYGRKPELVEIQYNLLKALAPEKVDSFLTHRLNRSGNRRSIVEAQATLWQKMSDEERGDLSAQQQLALAVDLLEMGQEHLSEKIYSAVSDTIDKNDQAAVADMAVLARKMASYYQQLGRDTQAEKYTQRAREIMQSSSNTMGVSLS